jgi:hypothetical protein
MNYGALRSRYEGDVHEQSALENADHKPILQVQPEQSVYSAILFCPALSRLKDGYSWNRNAKLALFLCFMNATLQMGVVRVIDVYDHAARLEASRMLLPSDEVIEEGDSEFSRWNKRSADAARESQADVHRRFLPPQEKQELDDVSEIEPLCKRIGDGNGTFTCMPHSVKFAFEWDNLDANGDGVWTIDEARCDYKDLKAKRHVSPETIFNNAINGLRMQAAYLRDSGSNYTLFLPPEVQQERSIPKAYFKYWAGDAMMCGLFDADSCEAAAKSGVFTTALVPGRMSPRAKGIYDLDSAIQYCYRMLQDGGGCEALLPVDFKRNREQRWERCGDRSVVEGGSYTNPFDDTQRIHVLEAHYESVEAYQSATSRLYLFFVSLVITLWLLSLISELRELIKFIEFLWVFPAVHGSQAGGTPIRSPRSLRSTSPRLSYVSDPAVASDSPLKSEVVYNITGIAFWHRFVLCVVFLIRILVFNVLSQFGTRFLLAETDYFNLVLNSLALTFILTIDGMLFALVENEVRDEVLNCKPLEFETRLPTGDSWAGYLLKKECWGLFAVPLISVIIVIHHNYQIKEPILTVLRCACTQEGSKCLDSIQYQEGWWEDYWAKTLPAAIHQIEAMRLKYHPLEVLGYNETR